MVAAPITHLGSLAAFDSEDLTPHIGTQFPSPNVQLSGLISAPNSNELIKDLATLVSHRGVVFFQKQDIGVQQLRELGTRVGELVGKPATSKLHRHPITEVMPELEDDYGDVGIISSEGGIAQADFVAGARASGGWHSDISFEPVTSDYAILKMHTIPKVGGDTLWASGYEAYDRLSPPFKSFLEGFTAVHNADFFAVYAKKHNIPIQDPRGSPENTGTDLTAVHPVIRSHPVTGFKTLFVNKSFTKRIPQLTKDESDYILDYLFRHVSENHDIQVRYRWSKDDVAIWDNRCTLHTATNDYNDLRVGDRVCSLGERPYFDPASKSRREALGL